MSPAVSPRIPATHGPLPALRAATRSRHDRIDRLVDLGRLHERARYGRVLQALEAFLGPWEARVLATLPQLWHGWLRQRSRRPFLQQDLRALDLAPLPPALAMPQLATPAAAWGSVYVQEGSALGGRVIARSLAQAGLHARAGAAYFNGWGEATGRLWSETRALLERELATPEHLAQACEGACLTFDALGQHLEAALHERDSLA